MAYFWFKKDARSKQGPGLSWTENKGIFGSFRLGVRYFGRLSSEILTIGGSKFWVPFAYASLGRSMNHKRGNERMAYINPIFRDWLCGNAPSGQTLGATSLFPKVQSMFLFQGIFVV